MGGRGREERKMKEGREEKRKEGRKREKKEGKEKKKETSIRMGDK